MIYKFSETAKNAIESAEKIAVSLGHNFVGSEHILYGIASQTDCIGYKVLKNQHITASKILIKMKEILGENKTFITRTEGFTPKTKLIIEDAYSETERLFLTNIGTEQLLLSIINNRENIAYKILVELGFDISRAYDDLLRIISTEEDFHDQQKERETKKTSNRVLSQYGADLNKLATENKIDEVIGRNKEIERLIQILSRRNKNNPCLIGEPGVGKTAIVEGLARKIVSQDVPELLRNKKIYTLDLTSVIAGAKYRGDFEERIKKCLNEVKKSKDIILFIDEIHTIVGAGSAEGAIDAANILKPILARGEIQLIGATTIDEYRKYIEKDAALERRFSPVLIEEPSKEETMHILQGIKDKYETHHNVSIEDGVLQEIVDLSARYINDRYMPDKAIDLLDEAASKIRMKAYTVPDRLKLMEKEIKDITQKKNEAIGYQDFEKAARLRDEEIEKKTTLEEEKEKWRNENIKQKVVLTKEDIREVVSNLTQIPLTQITENENMALEKLEENLAMKIVGQEEAIKSITQAIKRSRLGISDPRKPLCSFLFMGPTGVGKTAISKALAYQLFGDENKLVKLDMSEYMEPHSVSKIIGSPPGYVGFEEEGMLTKQVRKNPYSIILLDEIEKAHPDVTNILLQILDEGVLTDATGRKINFRNTIIIMTSNIGAKLLTENKRLGFGEERSDDEDQRLVMRELKKEFKPEFINRIDDIIVFHKLTKENIIQIIDIMAGEMQERLQSKGMQMELTKQMKEHIVSHEINLSDGARQLKRKLQTMVENRLAEEMLYGNLKEGQKIIFDVKNNEIFTKIE